MNIYVFWNEFYTRKGNFLDDHLQEAGPLGDHLQETVTSRWSFGNLGRLVSGNTNNIGWYTKLRVFPKYRVIPDTSGYPLPNDFQNWIGSGIKWNTGYRVEFGYPLGTDVKLTLLATISLLLWQNCWGMCYQTIFTPMRIYSQTFIGRQSPRWEPSIDPIISSK